MKAIAMSTTKKRLTVMAIEDLGKCQLLEISILCGSLLLPLLHYDQQLCVRVLGFSPFVCGVRAPTLWGDTPRTDRRGSRRCNRRCKQLHGCCEECYVGFYEGYFAVLSFHGVTGCAVRGVSFSECRIFMVL